MTSELKTIWTCLNPSITLNRGRQAGKMALDMEN
jgi:hypothetical protein